jgi:ATP-dependent metalloprotease
VDAASLAKRTAGFSGAELSNLVNEAALAAGKSGLPKITSSLLDDAQDKVLMGSERRCACDAEHGTSVTSGMENSLVLTLFCRSHISLYRAVSSSLQGADHVRRSMVRTAESLKRTAYHESGHALVAFHTEGAHPIHKATIVPRGHALGMVQQVTHPAADTAFVALCMCPCTTAQDTEFLES